MLSETAIDALQVGQHANLPTRSCALHSPQMVWPHSLHIPLTLPPTSASSGFIRQTGQGNSNSFSSSSSSSAAAPTVGGRTGSSPVTMAGLVALRTGDPRPSLAVERNCTGGGTSSSVLDFSADSFSRCTRFDGGDGAAAAPDALAPDALGTRAPSPPSSPGWRGRGAALLIATGKVL